MNTIPKPDRSAPSPRRSERSMSPETTSPRAKTVAGPPGASTPLASLKYGWRDVPKKLADGRIKVERVPLTLDDVVHPQFGDVHVLSDAHDDDCSYMKTFSRTAIAMTHRSWCSLTVGFSGTSQGCDTTALIWH